MSSFQDFALAAPLHRALVEAGFETPTPIQTQAIPHVMAGRDLLGIAQTGTGKTAAFALPILHRLLQTPKRPAPRTARALVLSPTRELATQIAEQFRLFGAKAGMKVAIVFGGVGHRPQVDAMRNGVDILVATPGRLLDHMGERAIDLSRTEVFVLDEADQMLDLGFLKPIKRVISHLPRDKQTLFFSATMPNEIGGLAGELLKNPVNVAVTPVAKTADRVEQRVIHVAHAGKRAVLVELLAKPEMTRTLVFTRTKRGADRVADHLEAAGVSAAAIHGNKSQNARERALDAFKKGGVAVLVATDIAARGIDVSAVSHVVNFELPEVPEAYVHRIGRTARAGAEGQAISLCAPDERSQLRDIERLTRQTIPAEHREVAPGQATDAAEIARARSGRANAGGGRRGAPPRARPASEAGASQGQRPNPAGQRQGRPGPRGARSDGPRPASAGGAPSGRSGDIARRGERSRAAAPSGPRPIADTAPVRRPGSEPTRRPASGGSGSDAGLDRMFNRGGSHRGSGAAGD